VSTETFTIKNTGNADLIVVSALLSKNQAQDFSVDITVPLTVTPGNSVNFTVKFSPTSDKPSQRKTQLQILSNDESKKPYTINLIGPTRLVVLFLFKF
jgi:hypothetical protein